MKIHYCWKFKFRLWKFSIVYLVWFLLRILLCSCCSIIRFFKGVFIKLEKLKCPMLNYEWCFLACIVILSLFLLALGFSYRTVTCFKCLFISLLIGCCFFLIIWGIFSGSLCWTDHCFLAWFCLCFLVALLFSPYFLLL